eukprot:Anaeramoba_flamelloidesc38593_g1_i1.p1 GENE.c38593_g1_i1~~c38593_g1_i1.p1  ORF type:complete len:115 (+),score=23.67 c38593_g1_i1:32-346(+)
MTGRIIRRVTGKDIFNFNGQTVRIVGEVANLQDNVVTLLLPDNNTLTVQREQGSQNYGSQIVELVVKVVDNQLQEKQFTNFSPKFDLQLYYQTIELTKQFSDVF